MSHTWSECNRELRGAAKAGDTAKCQQALEDGANLETTNEDGYTPIHLAACYGYKDLIEFLVSKGANLEAATWKEGATPLSIAARTNEKKDTVELLVSKGANLEAVTKNGWTPLHVAVYDGRKDTTEFLVFKGANLEARDNDGRTPLHLASSYGKKIMTELLVSQGANLEAKDAFGQTALVVAGWHDTEIRTILTAAQEAQDIEKVQLIILRSIPAPLLPYDLGRHTAGFLQFKDSVIGPLSLQECRALPGQ